jgi:hypothetical protein
MGICVRKTYRELFMAATAQKHARRSWPPAEKRRIVELTLARSRTGHTSYPDDRNRRPHADELMTGKTKPITGDRCHLIRPFHPVPDHRQSKSVGVY